MRRAVRGLVLVGMLALAGCGSILPEPAPPPSLYRLTAGADADPDKLRPVPVQLGVDVPAVAAALDTERIALARTPTTLDYFADAAWTDRLSAMIQALLIQSLDDSHRLAAVGPQAGPLHADVVLVTELRDFEARYDGAGPPHWRVELMAKLVKMPDRTILASRLFDGDAAAPRNDMAAIVTTADTAWHQVAQQLVDWVATSLAPRPR